MARTDSLNFVNADSEEYKVNINPERKTSATLYLCASILVLLVYTVASNSAAAAAPAPGSKPNIVIIFIDDMGYGDIGPFGNTVNKTPHLDRMAAEGLKLTQFYVANTACTPSRSALMTGTYAHRIGMDGSVVFPGEKRGLNPNEITIAEMLKTHGYATGCFGKWHLGDQNTFLPLAQGFDEYFGIPYSNDMWPGNKRGNPVTKRGPYEPLPVIRGNDAVAYVSDGIDQSLLAEVVTDEAIKFIKAHREKPFFCYVPHAYIHNPRFARPEILKRAEGDTRRANIEEVDDSVGRILGTLRELDLAKETLVLFTSDNGGAQVGLLRGAKGGPKYEGHMREPTLAWWPGNIRPGTETSEIATTIDLLPSLARLSGAKVPGDRIIDGKDALDVLLGKPGAKSPHEILYYETMGIRRGDWKLVRMKKKGKGIQSELYNLKDDVGEKNNIAAKHPELVKELNELLDAHIERVAADTRPAGFVEDAKPILPLGTPRLPRLRELMGMPNVTVGNPMPVAPKPKVKPKPKAARPGAPDVLFIAIDDMNDWTTLFDKNNPIKTPNLERLAARGAFFSKAYCAVPACNPSRTAILTGLAPTTSGVYANGNPWKELLPDVVTLPQYFGQQGYATKGGGKIFHHGGTGADRKDRPSFEEFFKLRIHANKPKTNYNSYKRGDRKIGGLGSPSWDWGVHDVEKQTDEFTVEYVNGIMKSEPRDKPLFLAAGIFRPHLPFWAPPKTFARYPFDQTKMPPRPSDDLSDVPPIGVRMSRTESFIFDNTIKLPVDRPGSLKKMVQSYQAAADYADEMVGRLIDQLDASGRVDKTIIILWSDHGYHLGDKSACVKFTLWEKANHVPFIIVAPGVTKPGTVIDRPISLLDIYPTLVELAGLPKKDGLDGASLVPLLKNPKAKWNRPAIMTQGRGNHAVRSDRWRYIRYSDGTEELYDHNNDPWEWKNLAGDPKHAKVIAGHKKWLPKHEVDPAQRLAAQRNRKPKPNGKPKPNAKPNKRPAPGRPLRVDVTPAEYKSAKNDILIADFEGDNYGDWQVTGEAFGKGPSQESTHRNRVMGYLGKGFINTYLNGDKTTGELVSPPFKIERKHINFLIGGGNHPGRVGIQLRVDDKTVRFATGFSMKNTKNQEIMDWKSLDVKEFIGKQAVIKIVDKHSGGWGHTVVDHIFQSDNPMPARLPDALKKANVPAPKPPAPKPGPTRPAISPREPKSIGFVPPPKPGVTLKDEWSTFPLYDQVGYDQALRPQFHFTSRMCWLNDPNGMVYYDGEWHMYFQHVAIKNNTGPKSWGNAKSTDLMHWKQFPHAINPYPNIHGKEGDHTIWSGSAVVDVLNGLGKQKGDAKTLFALFTATNPDGFFQGGAYSTDRGRTWIKVNGGKPVIPHQVGFSKGQRDPRVFYYAPGKYYVTIMMIGGKDRAVRLWKSTDLLNWEIIGDIPNKAAECIDMFHVAVDGDPNKRLWVIADAATRYEVGEFDGTTWKGLGAEDKDGQRLRFDYGDAWYAAQAFNQAPKGRVVHVGWLRSKQAGYRPFLEANMPFTQQMSIPIEITLRTTPDGIRMFRNPVKEIEELYSESTKLNNVTAKEANARLATLKPELIDMTLAFAPKGNATLNVRGMAIHYDAAKQEFQFTNKARVEGERAAWRKKGSYRDTGLRAIPAPAIDGIVMLRVLVDRASMELFVNDGQAAASFVVVPRASNRSIRIEGNDDLRIASLVVNELKSIWPATRKTQTKNPPKTKPAAPKTSKDLAITGKYLLLPIRGRNKPDGTRYGSNSMRILVDGVLVHQYWASLARSRDEIEFWSYVDMSEHIGKTADVRIVRGPLDGTGRVLDMIESSNELRSLKPFYTETGRPQFHFSQRVGWNNDVNGMVYSDGLYHLSWQCNPVGRHWNNMYWGHAVSKDLVQWEEWPRVIRVGGGVAKDGPIHPAMSLGPAFSGSACVDHNNTLGKQVGDTKTLIACFTDVGGGDQSESAKGEKFTGESLAYSTDNGRTYHMLRDFNPIISHRGRDPKLFWYEPGKHWCIVTYRAAKKITRGVPPKGKMAFYTSKNLKDWTFASFSETVFHECPEFVQLPVDDDPNNNKWLLFDATPKYQVGTFDGKTFKSEFEGTRQTIGGSLKAAQCFSNAPGAPGRRAICMVWARFSPKDPKAPFNQGFTLPMDLSLRTATDGVRCYANPVKELKALRQGELAAVANKPVNGETRIPLTKPQSHLEIELTLQFKDGKKPDRVALSVGNNTIIYDVASKTFPEARLTSYDREDGKLDLRVFVDSATIEVFAEHGAVFYLQPRRIQGETVRELGITVDGGSASVEQLKVYKLKSIWK